MPVDWSKIHESRLPTNTATAAPAASKSQPEPKAKKKKKKKYPEFDDKPYETKSETTTTGTDWSKYGNIA